MAKILVVDDETIQVETICRGLRLFGYEAISAQNGNAAFEILKSDEGDGVDLLLTDLTMPENNGFCLIEQVRVKRPKLPIIVITGLNPNTEIECLRDKGIPILQKPFCPDKLDLYIRNLIGKN